MKLVQGRFSPPLRRANRGAWRTIITDDLVSPPLLFFPSPWSLTGKVVYHNAFLFPFVSLIAPHFFFPPPSFFLLPVAGRPVCRITVRCEAHPLLFFFSPRGKAIDKTRRVLFLGTFARRQPSLSSAPSPSPLSLSRAVSWAMPGARCGVPFLFFQAFFSIAAMLPVLASALRRTLACFFLFFFSPFFFRIKRSEILASA